MIKDYLKTVPQFVLPKLALTRFAGLLANVQSPNIKNALIRQFILKYKVNMAEAKEENFANYTCFNDFFIRHLKPECRILATTDVVSPVDGFISEVGSIEEGQILQAKGRYYTVEELLACDKALSEQFAGGRFATFYLSPKDYHRVHMPIDAVLREMIYVPGRLFSVQPATVRTIPRLFARNQRLIAFFDTEAGLMAMVLVGATIVGAIGNRWQGELQRSRQKQHFTYTESKPVIHKGEEMGYFKLGSTVVLLFADGKRIHWLDHLKPGVQVCYGEPLAELGRHNSIPSSKDYRG
jgi:phosphatidylserine decarboxylase